jgi:twitching motility protein PilT
MSEQKYREDIEKLLSESVEKKATDLHLSVGRPPILRIDGSLVNVGSWPVLDSKMIENLIFSLLTKDQQEKLAVNRDIDLSLALGDEARFRINVYQERNNLAAALRFIPSRAMTIEDLNLPPVLHKFTQASQGFFLVVGPSGHGKSTALAAMIDEINHSRQDHIITIEDPIEYIFVQDKCIIDQREVGIDVADFHAGLRAMFRQDADVCMIGEMRDPETISAAMTAAETGHLIFSTLHTNNAAQTIDRIIDTFPPHQQGQIKIQLAATLLGVLSRRLIPAINGGLINAVELLIANSALRNLIREGKTHQIDMVIDTSYEEGMISLNRSLADLVSREIISYENAVIYSNNPQELKMMLSS